MLRHLAWRTALNKFGLVGSPPCVVDTKCPFQHAQFKWTQVFFLRLIAMSADLLLFHMTLFDSAWPDPCQLLKLEQLLCKHPLQLFRCFHALLLPVSTLVTPPPHPRTACSNRPPRTVHPAYPGQPA